MLTQQIHAGLIRRRENSAESARLSFGVYLIGGSDDDVCTIAEVVQVDGLQQLRVAVQQPPAPQGVCLKIVTQAIQHY